jgi:hypothetical protein
LLATSDDVISVANSPVHTQIDNFRKVQCASVGVLRNLLTATETVGDDDG